MTGRRVLMIAYWFPPCVRWPTASKRAAGFARWLPSFGWDPVVLVPDLASAGVCDCVGCREAARCSGTYEIRRLPVGARHAWRMWRLLSRRGAGRLDASRSVPGPTFTSLVETRVSWVASATDAALQICAEQRPDIVWTTSGPYSSIRVGDRVQRSAGISWVADLRDPVSAHLAAEGIVEMAIELMRRPLRRTLRRADAVVAATPPLADLDSEWLGRPVVSVPSGYDPELWESFADPGRPPDTFRILCSGTIYPGQHRPELLTQAVSLLVRGLDPTRNIEIRYVGRDPRALLDAARNSGVEDLVEVRGFVHPETMPQELRSAHVLVHFTYASEVHGVPGGKLYEYLASGRPIISLPNTDRYVNEALAVDPVHAEAATAQAASDRLGAWYREFQEYGDVEGAVVDNIREHSFRRRADQLSSIFERVVPSRT